MGLQKKLANGETMNKYTKRDEQIQAATTGTDNFHELMTQLAKHDIVKRGAYIVPNMPKSDDFKPINPYHWQSQESHINAGNLWIFHAVELGHFTPSQAKRIWNYGQNLLDVKRWNYILSTCEKYNLEDVAVWLTKMIFRAIEFEHAYRFVYSDVLLEVEKERKELQMILINHGMRVWEGTDLQSALSILIEYSVRRIQRGLSTTKKELNQSEKNLSNVILRIDGKIG